ncbi:phage tail protein [Paenibacillaceae bacterium WGS1546]|uniref:phage tail protein n=1 Tax=Cohnella sp. WGS1546 TaxID=3366810 RepID=UPI00372D8548
MPYIGEIRMFAGDFAPDGWELCDGRLIAIRANPTLFSIIGNYFGGDGFHTFALPDFRGRAPMHAGTGTGLTPREFGAPGGSSAVELTLEQMPAHSHPAGGSTAASASQYPVGAYWGRSTGGRIPVSIYSALTDQPMNEEAIGPVGEGVPHNNMQPYLGVQYIISLNGDFPD